MNYNTICITNKQGHQFRLKECCGMYKIEMRKKRWHGLWYDSWRELVKERLTDNVMQKPMLFTPIATNPMVFFDKKQAVEMMHAYADHFDFVKTMDIPSSKKEWKIVTHQ